MAVYPPAIPSWTTKRDYIDPIFARHFNIVQEEVRAVEVTVGITPQKATSNPGGLTPDYGTVASRIQASARGEPMCSYRGLHLGALVTPNTAWRPTLTVAEDTHDCATDVGYRLPETGYWVIIAKADWTPTAASSTATTTRTVGIEINGVDVGLRDSLLENTKIRPNMTTAVTWQERLPKGTHLSTVLKVVLADTTPLPVNVYLRAYLVRCLGEGEITGLPSTEFTPGPPPNPPPPAPGVTTPATPPPPPAPETKFVHRYIERFDGGYNAFYNDGTFYGIVYDQTIGTAAQPARR